MKKNLLPLACVLVCTNVWADDVLHVWVRAFIPQGTPLEVANRCFEGDARKFSTSVSASSRLTTEFELVSKGQDITVRKAGGREYFRAGVTIEKKCVGAAILEKKTADVSSLRLGAVAVDADTAQLYFTGSAPNPLTPPVLSPKIDYDGAVTWLVKDKKVKLRLTVGKFPAFEAYAQLNGGPVLELLEVDPESGASPFALYDFGLGLNSRAYEVSADLVKVPAIQ